MFDRSNLQLIKPNGMAAAKIDVKKLVPAYKATSKMTMVDVPPMSYLMVDGKGDPNKSKDFEAAIGALYKMSYTLKFTIKKSAGGVDYGVMPLEALWWADDMDDFLKGRKENWYWTAMIMQPEFVTKELVLSTITALKTEKKLDPAVKLRFEEFTEGKCAQVLYTGPYSDEHETILKLHDFIHAGGNVLRGHHHEIYLNDMRRTAPEKLKTIVRQPVGEGTAETLAKKK